MSELEQLKRLRCRIREALDELDPDRMRTEGHVPDEAQVWDALREAWRASEKLRSALQTKEAPDE